MGVLVCEGTVNRGVVTSGSSAPFHWEDSLGRISSKAIFGLTEKIKSQRVFTGNMGANPKFNWSGCKDLNLFFHSFNLSFHSFIHSFMRAFIPFLLPSLCPIFLSLFLFTLPFHSFLLL